MFLNSKIFNLYESTYFVKYRLCTKFKFSYKAYRSKNMKANKQFTKYAPGTVTLQVLGCGAQGAPASVYLFTDQSRYLFNCGEGTQRLAHEHKTKLSRLQHIFFTGKCWSKLGGLPGLTLTAQDAGVTQITLHGPPELNTFFQAMNRFVVLKKIHIQTESTLDQTILDDEVMTVDAIPILSGNSKTNATIMYVCKLKPKPGALDLKKCVEMGVPTGPLLGLLKSGVDVVLENGITVKSADVSEPTTGDQTIIFVDVPNESYFDSLADQFDKHKNAAIVIHFASDDVVKSSFYQKFLNQFEKSTKHMFLNSSNRFSGHFAAHRFQIQLNQLDNQIFPLLGEVENTNVFNEDFKRVKLNPPENLNNNENSDTINGIVPDVCSLTCFRLRPFKGLDRSMELKYTPEEYLKETQHLEGFTEALHDYKATQKNEERNEKQIYPKITFLGTGSCIPNKTRNVSAILLEPKEESFVLLDCGEGTLGQIVRLYGPSNWHNVVQNLKAIYISHLHADHHIGLIGLLKERSRLLGENSTPIFLFAPLQIRPWLNYYHDTIEPIADYYRLIPNGEMVNAPYESSEIQNLGINSLSTCLVKHCQHSFGISMLLTALDKNSEPIKVTYSGDTMPCNDLIKLGSNSTILIHEATMEDELIEEAKIKMHCTVSQALLVAEKMKAKNTILTHFSQRYAKLPRMPEGLSHNVAIAFDFMQVSIDDLKNFSAMYPVMKLMFQDHYEEMEKKTQMRLIKSERKRKSDSLVS